MRKVLGALAFLVVVLILAWGYKTVKEALLGPVALVERMAGPYDIVFGKEEVGGAGRVDHDALVKSLQAVGIKPGANMAMLISASGGHARTGAIIGKGDLVRARTLGGDFLVVHLTARKGWAAAREGGSSDAVVATALTMGRTISSLMAKAKALGWTSFCLVTQFGGGDTEAVIVPGPR